MESQVYEQVVAVYSVELLQRYRFWKRLEPRARNDNFIRSVQSRIRDPLWMLTRQWQVGEFKAEDAGSPVKTYMQTERTHLTHYKPKKFEHPGSAKPIPDNIPLERLVEQEIFFDYRMSIQIGLQFEKELKKKDVSEEITIDIKRKFALSFPNEDDRIKIDDETLSILEAIAKPDDFEDAAQIPISGEKLFNIDDLVSKDPQIPDDLQQIFNSDLDKITDALKALHLWYTKVYFQPVLEEETAWDHSNFDYSFCVSAPKNENEQHVLEITDYTSGDLDWLHFTAINDPDKKLDYNEDTGQGFESDEEQQFIPTPVSFKGMPNSRWWAFEDSKIDFGNMDVKTTDLGKLLLMEFAFIYGDDWFQIPVPLKIGSLCKIKKLEVRDVFGGTHNINRAGSEEDQSWQRWEMFSISHKREKQVQQIYENGTYDSADFLFLPPTLGRSENSSNIDEVRFIRDEMANKVWAIEQIITGNLGQPLAGFDCWKHINYKIDEKTNTQSIIKLLDLFNKFMPDILQSKIEQARGIEGIVELIEELSEIDELLKSLECLKGEIADNTSIEYLNLIFELNLEIIKNKDAFQRIINDETNIQNLTLLRRFSGVLTPCIDSLEKILPYFRRANYTSTLELLETCNQVIKEELNKLINISILSEDQRAIFSEIEESRDDSLSIYKIMSVVPKNWIPYIPISTGSGQRSIQLKQANLIRNEKDNEPKPVKAQSRILKSAESNGEKHLVNEEAVARHGINIQIQRQRTRWIDGSTHTWQGRKVGPGKGEGSSGLKFDFLNNNTK